MLDQDIQLRRENALEGVLIAAETHKVFKQNSVNREQIRKYVSHQLREAKREAEKIEKIAYKTAYEHGFMDIYELFETFFLERKQLVLDLSKLVDIKLQNVVTSLWQNDDVVLSTLKNSLKENPFQPDEINKMIIFLPKKRQNHRVFLEKLKDLLPNENVEWVFHDEERYIIKNNDQIIELNLSENTQKIKKHIQKQLDMQHWAQQFHQKFCRDYIEHLKAKDGMFKKGGEKDDDNT